MKKSFFFILGLLTLHIGFAQDTIHLKTGSEIKAKIVEIGAKEVKYKKYDFKEGPDYFLPKKRIEYIAYNNGKKEFFYGYLSKPEYQALCERKINYFRKQQKAGIAIAGLGLTGTTINGIGNYNYNVKHPNTDNWEQQLAYDVGYFFGIGAIVGGTVMYIIGKHKVNQYSEKLNNLLISLNYSRNLKGLTLVYSF